MENFFGVITFYLLMIPFCLLAMDDTCKLEVVQKIPFEECHHVIFAENDTLILCSRYADIQNKAFNWKTNEKINHPLLTYDLFAFDKDCWNRNIISSYPWINGPQTKKYRGYNMQLQQSWVVDIPVSANLRGFSDHDPDFLIIQDNYYDAKNTKIYLLSCKDNSKILQEHISSIFKEYKQVDLQYYNSTLQRAIYCLKGIGNDELCIHDFKNNNASIKKHTVMNECRCGQTFISTNNAFGVYLILNCAHFVKLTGENKPRALRDPCASVMIHPNNKYIFTMSCHGDSTIQIWDSNGVCILRQQSPTPDEDNAKERARNYSAYWNAFSLSDCGKYLAVAFPTQCVIYELPFKMIYGIDRGRLMRIVFFLKNIFGGIPQDIRKFIIFKIVHPWLLTCK